MNEIALSMFQLSFPQIDFISFTYRYIRNITFEKKLSTRWPTFRKIYECFVERKLKLIFLKGSFIFVLK